VPTSENDVTIPTVANQPNINNAKITPAECKDMTIATGASVTIDPNKGLTVHGNVSNSGTIHVKSTGNGINVHDTHDGSLIIIGSISGGGTYKIDRYISGNFWHMVSSPVTSATASVFTNMWIRTYNENSNAWGNFITSPSTPLVKGAGYAVWTYDTYQIRQFNGTINHDATIAMPNLAYSGAGKGWNLIGNPYPSAIHWQPNNGSKWTRTNISNTIYVFSAKVGNYMTWNGMVGSAGPMIAMGQGFFVQAFGASPQLSIHHAARLHHEVSFRSNELVDNIIEIAVEGNGYADKTFIMVREDAQQRYDFNYDATKLDGLAEAPQLFTFKGDDKVAVNSFSRTSDIHGTLVHLNIGESKEYAISFTQTLTDDVTAVLRDRFNNELIYSGEVYTFSANSNDPSARFEILDLNNVANVSTMPNEVIQVWESDNILYVSNVNTQFHISVYDILGQEVMQSVQNVTSLETLPNGVYLVKVVTGNQSIVQKISTK